MDIYSYDKELEEKIEQSADDLLKYAILETQIPICDYSRSIEVIYKYIFIHKDIRLCILGAFLSSVWESYKENKFIKLLDQFIEEASNEELAIINYLKAYDIRYHEKEYYKNCKYRKLLKRSIYNCSKFVYNYKALAEISSKKEALALMEIAISNVEEVFINSKPYDINELTLNNINELTSYNAFLEENILGIRLSEPNYLNIIES